MEPGKKTLVRAVLRLAVVGLVIGTAAVSVVGSTARVAGAATPPTVTGVAPKSGPSAGGTVVTVTGTNLGGVTQVLFGTVAGTGVTVVSGTEVTVTSPAEAVGVRNIVVVTPDERSNPNTNDEFDFEPPAPVVTGVSPRSGPSNGGTAVTITGTNLKTTGTTQVLFGTLTAQVSSSSSTTLTAVSPRQAAGLVNVFVKTPGGKSRASSADWFTYQAAPPAPIVSGVSPTQGPAAGGTTVTLAGSFLTGATQVLFGTVPATSFTVVSDTEITATSPVHAIGETTVFVVTPNGTSAGGTGAGFYFAPPVPVVTGVSPRSGTSNGGTAVTITGTNLSGTGTTTVYFGSLAAQVTSSSSTKLTAVSPRQAAGLVNVFVKTPGGKSGASSADWFTYVAEPPAPIVSGVSPKSGPVAGGTVVTVTGTNLTGTTQVLFGTVPGTVVTVVSDTELTVTSPAEAAGLRTVFVVTPNGKSAISSAAGFDFK